MADIGSDHDLVMMTFRVRLKRARKPTQLRLKLTLRSYGPQMWHATKGRNFAPLIGLRDDEMDIQLPFSGSNTAGPFTTAVSNSFLSHLEKISWLQI